jgi:hypothetical protein
MIENITNAGVNLVYGVWAFFVDIAPHNFGVILVPLLILGGFSLLAARRPQAH